MADEKELVRSRIDIVDLIGQRVRLKKSGRNWTGLCPFHEDRNPSFSVNAEIGRYKCWACGAAGDVFTWVMNTQGLEFRDALELLARQAGVELSAGRGPDKSKRQAMADAMATAQSFFRAQLNESRLAIDYCEGRGLGEDVRSEWGIGYAPDIGEALVSELKRRGYRLSDCKELSLVEGDERNGYGDRFKGRLMFPIHDDQGNLVAFGGRVIGDGFPKYINSSDTPLFNKGRTLYGMHKAKESVRTTRQAVLVEGYLDVIACHRAGVENAVATLGTALGEQHVKRLGMWADEVVVLYDSDEAGQKAAERAAELLTGASIKTRVALMPEGQDPDTLLREKGPEAVREAVKAGVEPVEFLLQQIGQRHPVESETYWQEATAALANLSNPLEVERYLMPLAGRYPFLRDPQRAARTLRKMVHKAARSRVAKPQSRETVTKKDLLSPSWMEFVVFQALIDEDSRHAAWAVCTDESLFLTEESRHLARSLKAAWPDDAPGGSPEVLINGVEDSVRDLLVEALMGRSVTLQWQGKEDTKHFKIDADEIPEIRRRLTDRAEAMRLRSIEGASTASDEDLKAIDARLKELKGAKHLENP